MHDARRRTLGQALDEAGGIGPGFNVIRLVAAAAVLVGHAFELTGRAAFDPLRWLSGDQTNLGGTAVYLFFFMSGFLVTPSLLRSPSLAHFAGKRALRIFPALVVVVVLAALVLGPVVTTMPPSQYVRDDGFRAYFGNVLFLSAPFLPGVFELPSIQLPVNGSLWTLPYEALCYALLPVAVATGLLARRRVLAAFTTVLIVLGWWAKNRHMFALWPIAIEFPYVLRFVAYFAAGVSFYAFRYKIPLDVRLAIAALVIAVAFLCVGLYHMFFPVLGGYLMAFCGMHDRLHLPSLRDRDYSYGVYLYAWPMQALVVSVLPHVGWGTNVLLSAPPTLLLAVLSWHLVERPALSLKRSADAPPAPDEETWGVHRAGDDRAAAGAPRHGRR